MRTQKNNTRNLIRSVAIALMMLSVANVASAQKNSRHHNHYRTDFIKQMVYQLSNEVMEKTGFMRYARQTSNDNRQVVLASYTLPLTSGSVGIENEMNLQSLETELTAAVDVYSPAKIETSENCECQDAELENAMIQAAAPYHATNLSFEECNETAEQELECLLTQAVSPYTPAEYDNCDTESYQDELNLNISSAFQPYQPGDYAMEINSNDRINVEDPLEQAMIAAAGLLVRY